MPRYPKLAVLLNGAVFVSLLLFQWASLEHMVSAFGTVWSPAAAQGVGLSVVFANAALAGAAIVNQTPHLRRVMLLIVAFICAIEIAMNVFIAAGELAANLPHEWAAFLGVGDATMWRIATLLLAAWPPLIALGLTYVFTEGLAQRAARQDEPISMVERLRRDA
jgi:hypothetical protein